MTVPIVDVVAIDGPSGAGKSTVARRVAERLGWRFLDTGAMYRAVAWRLLEDGAIDGSGRVLDGGAVEAALGGLELEMPVGGRVLVDGHDVTRAIREHRIEAVVSAVAAMPRVRARLRELQRAVAADGPLVAEGRDMATVVFPGARFQVYLDASVEERARRRHADFVERGRDVGIEEVRAEIERRDALDRAREDGPLRCAPGAVLVDSDAKTVDEIVESLVAWVRGGGEGVPPAGGAR